MRGVFRQCIDPAFGRLNGGQRGIQTFVRPRGGCRQFIGQHLYARVDLIRRPADFSLRASQLEIRLKVDPALGIRAEVPCQP